MAIQTTLLGALSPEMKTFYDRTLMVRTLPALIFAQFAQSKELKAGQGKVIEFRKFSGLAVAKTPLTEGTLYTNLKDLAVTAVTATVIQYGDAVGFSDLISTVAIDPILTETTEILGEQAGETIDELVRDVVVSGTSIQYPTARVSRATIVAGDILTPLEVRRAVLQLKLNRARKINGFYQCILHLRAAADLMESQEWRDAQNYNQTGRIFDGSLGTLYGVKFWETDKSPVLVNAAGTVDVFQTMFFGADAYGIVKLSGHNLKTIYKALGSAGAADPLDQQQTMGWKVTFGTRIIEDLFMLRVEHATSTADNAA